MVQSECDIQVEGTGQGGPRGPGTKLRRMRASS